MSASDPEIVQTFERRAFVRYARKLETLWTYLGLGSHDLAGGEVFDLSTTGIGLQLGSPFPEGTTLLVRLQSSTSGWSTYLVRVKRCVETSTGSFQVGCAFIKPLSVAQLESLLR